MPEVATSIYLSQKVHSYNYTDIVYDKNYYLILYLYDHI